MSTFTKLINYEDSLTMPENPLEEIVRGVSRIMPPATKDHSYLTKRLSRLLESQLGDREHEVLSLGLGLGIERVPLTYRIPDLMVFRTEALQRDRAETCANDPYIWAVPELIVECLSLSNRKGSVRDLLADYERIATPEVWLLDPKLPRFTAYRFESGSLGEWQTMSLGTVDPWRLPNAPVDLDELWTAFHSRMV
ncbi:MAG TPA: Uma2 family endonuclease [Bryobacteraceae bacterium]|jgi:Uma2 family endonuclease|nr:Uma2 family endonuclease [Bryobacteraceae bacterium]